MRWEGFRADHSKGCQNWLPFSIDSSGSLVKEMGKLRPRNRGEDLTKVMQQVAGKGQAHAPFQTRPTAATDLMPRG